MRPNIAIDGPAAGKSTVARLAAQVGLCLCYTGAMYRA